jgi:DNA repair protein RadC
MRIIQSEVYMGEDKMPVLVKHPAKLYKPLQHLSSPEDVVQVMSDVFQADRQIAEQVYLIALDNRAKPLGFFLLNRGTVSKSLVDIRGMMISLLLCNAASFILVHNHVSGEVIPSQEDGILTENVKQAAQLLEIQFCDHIIIGENRNNYSFCRECWQKEKIGC